VTAHGHRGDGYAATMFANRFQAFTFSGLRHEPVALTGAWERKTVATRHPVRGEHAEWRWKATLRADAPFVAAVILETTDRLWHGRLPASLADPELSLDLAFGPWDWHTSPTVQVSFMQWTSSGGAGQKTLVGSGPLKLSPPDHTTMLAPTMTTGAYLPLASVAEEVVASVVFVTRNDVVVSHDRWHLPEDLRLPQKLRWLVTGRRSGAVSLEA
jgi:hypothetical protein